MKDLAKDYFETIRRFQTRKKTKTLLALQYHPEQHKSRKLTQQRKGQKRQQEKNFQKD